MSYFDDVVEPAGVADKASMQCEDLHARLADHLVLVEVAPTHFILHRVLPRQVRVHDAFLELVLGEQRVLVDIECDENPGHHLLLPDLVLPARILLPQHPHQLGHRQLVVPMKTGSSRSRQHQRLHQRQTACPEEAHLLAAPRPPHVYRANHIALEGQIMGGGHGPGPWHGQRQMRVGFGIGTGSRQ